MKGNGESPLRVGIGLISVGWMGRVHSQSYGRVNYHFPDLTVRPQLVIAADTVSERVEFAKDVLGYSEGTEDWRKVLTHPAVDAVSITVPNYLHHEIAVAAAEKGKHFWVEKPVGRNPAETADIKRAAATAGVMTAVGFNYRHVPAVQRAYELIHSGTIGRVVHARGIFLNDHAADPRGALSWRFQRELSGYGVVGDLLSHVIDLLQYLIGEIAAVSSLMTTAISQRPVLPMGIGDHFAVLDGGEMGPVENEDYVGALLRFGEGAVGVCEASRVTVGPRCKIGFDIFCTDGAVSWDFERMNELRVCIGKSGQDHGYRTVLAGPGMGEYANFQPGPAISMSYDDLKVIESLLFLRSIGTGTQFGASVADALATAQVLAALSRSAGSGEWVQVERHSL
jgi:predicted dehydrogenase